MSSHCESKVVARLAAHEAESGLVTGGEVEFVRNWVDFLKDNTGGKRPGKGPAWLGEWLGTARPFGFVYGGKESGEILDSWNFETLPLKSGTESECHKLAWTDPATGLKVAWTLRRFLDYPAVDWLLAFENTGAKDTPIIENILALDLRINSPSGNPCYTVHGAKGGRTLPDDLMPFSHKCAYVPVELGTPYDRQYDHSSTNDLPFFNLETPDSRGVMVGIGWSGTWAAKIEYDQGNGTLHTTVGQRTTHFFLRPGESVRTLRILVLPWQGKRLHGHNMLRQLLHKHYVPRIRGELHKPLVIAAASYPAKKEWRACGLDELTSEERITPQIKPAIELGAEILMVDAGWFLGAKGSKYPEWIGNWGFHRVNFPGGMKAIAEQLKKGDITLGMWFDTEVVKDIIPVRNQHPEWFLERRDMNNFAGLRVDLPAAREWFLGHVDDLVKNHGLGCFRQDGDLSSKYGYEDATGDRMGISECKHIAGLYTLWDELIERHPAMIMENCCNGGNRIDLETISRFLWHWKSDRYGDIESDQCGLYGANLFLPGGVIEISTLYPGDYGCWSSFAGQLTYGWRVLDDDFLLETAKLNVARYKRIRHLISGDFYPLTGCSQYQPWLGYQFHRPDLDQGMALLFRRSGNDWAPGSETDRYLVRFRGLDPKTGYRLNFERSKHALDLNGADLDRGIEVAIDEAPGAEMITYEAVIK